MSRCSVGSCLLSEHAWGMCTSHYHKVRREMIRNGDWNDRRKVQPAVCTCASPSYESCGPFFPDVLQCRWCGSPHPDQFTQPLEACR